MLFPFVVLFIAFVAISFSTSRNLYTHSLRSILLAPTSTMYFYRSTILNSRFSRCFLKIVKSSFITFINSSFESYLIIIFSILTALPMTVSLVDLVVISIWSLICYLYSMISLRILEYVSFAYFAHSIFANYS